LVYPPSLNFTIAFLACLKAGVVAVPVFPPNPARRDSLHMFAVIVAACDATYALTVSTYNYQKKLASIKDALTTKFQKRAIASWPESLAWIVTDKQTTNSTHNKSSAKQQTKWKTSRRDAAKPEATTTDKTESPPSVVIPSSQLAFLQFTSGSTSDPKGVMITHGNLAHNLHCITNELEAVQDTVVVSWLPQYHDMGLIGSVLGILYCGGTGYYMSPLTFLQRPMMWMEAVSKQRATHLQAPNFSFKLTARKFDKSTAKELDLSSVRHVINAAEPVDQDSMETFYKVFGPYGFGKVIYPTYGLAEHTVFVCSGGKQILKVLKMELEVDGLVVLANDKVEAAVSKIVGCGYPSSQGIDVKIVNTDAFTAVPEDIVGEIWVRSPSKAAGYYNKPQETKDDFHALLKPSSSADTTGDSYLRTGYLRTGDLGFIHQNELFICGRLKDLIIIGGRNYYPQDIEATAETSSDLVRLGCSAAFTIDPIHEGGEEVALVMELKEVPASKDVASICAPLANQIRAAINQEHSLGISSMAFLKARTVPKTSSGKIARAWCRKGYAAGTLQVVYQRSFKCESSSLEIEQANATQQPARTTTTALDAATVRAMSKEGILNSLITDVSKVGHIPADSVEKKVPLVHMLDSLTISQFKGMLENNYAVKISDEYLFRESTTLTKLVEVVKLGHAPDDTDGENAAATAAGPGHARGLAGALGCPPGVFCVIQ
jgi:acyl-CoA synthetase (AMP-forming)/AMP-acid ligase II